MNKRIEYTDPKLNISFIAFECNHVFDSAAIVVGDDQSITVRDKESLQCLKDLLDQYLNTWD